jgi:hypothetical protein
MTSSEVNPTADVTFDAVRFQTVSSRIASRKSRQSQLVRTTTTRAAGAPST